MYMDKFLHKPRTSLHPSIFLFHNQQHGNDLNSGASFLPCTSLLRHALPSILFVNSFFLASSFNIVFNAFEWIYAKALLSLESLYKILFFSIPLFICFYLLFSFALFFQFCCKEK